MTIDLRKFITGEQIYVPGTGFNFKLEFYQDCGKGIQIEKDISTFSQASHIDVIIYNNIETNTIFSVSLQDKKIKIYPYPHNGWVSLPKCVKLLVEQYCSALFSSQGKDFCAQLEEKLAFYK